MHYSSESQDSQLGPCLCSYCYAESLVVNQNRAWVGWLDSGRWRLVGGNWRGGRATGWEVSLRVAVARPVAARDGLATRAHGSATEWHIDRVPRRRSEVGVGLRRYSLVRGGWWLWFLGTRRCGGTGASGGRGNRHGGHGSEKSRGRKRRRTTTSEALKCGQEEWRSHVEAFPTPVRSRRRP